MQYVEKMNSDELYNTIITKVNNDKWTEAFLKIFKHHMDKYKNDKEQFVEDFIIFLNEMIDEFINGYDEYNGMSEEECLKIMDYPDHIRKIQKDFSDYGFIISPVEAYIIWGTRSDNCCAQWLDIMDDTDTFIEVINYCLICPC